MLAAGADRVQKPINFRKCVLPRLQDFLADPVQQYIDDLVGDSVYHNTRAATEATKATTGLLFQDETSYTHIN